MKEEKESKLKGAALEWATTVGTWVWHDRNRTKHGAPLHRTGAEGPNEVHQPYPQPSRYHVRPVPSIGAQNNGQIVVLANRYTDRARLTSLVEMFDGARGATMM